MEPQEVQMEAGIDEDTVRTRGVGLRDWQVEQLDKEALKRGWSRGKVVREMIKKAKEAGWLT